MALRETPYSPVDRILTGHEHRLRNRCWRRYGTPTPLLVYTRSGQAVARVEGRDDPQVMAPGDTVLWLPGATQDFDSYARAEPWELVWAHFQPREHWHEWLTWPRLAPGIARVPVPPPRLRARIDEALLDMDSHARSTLPRASEFALNALERALLWLDAANPKPSQLDESVQEAVLFISRHLDQRLSVQDIATAAHLSTSRLAHVFKEQIGISPARFVEQRRLERARVLLESSSLPIGAISETVGFSSQFYFAARFKASTGTSPRDWRHRMQRSHPT
jgi:AraC family transcriptional regulator of arabinose operon